MIWEEYATDNIIRSGIVRFLNAIRDVVMYFKWFRPMEKEKDPQKRLEKKLHFEMMGVRYGGMGMRMSSARIELLRGLALRDVGAGYPWSGNVRAMQQAVKRNLTGRCEGDKSRK